MRLKADWLDSAATRQVMQLLTSQGYQAYFVGGCVRNALLGAPATDIDIATDALPHQVMELAEQANLKAIPTGVEHGTVTVIAAGQPFEVTTFRRDVQTDGRRAVVAFSKNIDDDARRRDFTMNALYADLEGEIVDPLGGLPDLASRRLKFIDDASERIREDYLRILRFFRFHAYYADRTLGMDADAIAAIADNVDGLQTLSGERVGAEMKKLLAAPDPSFALASMQAAGVLGQVRPGSDTKAVAPLVHLEGDIPPRWQRRAVALGGEDIADRWRLSKAEAKELTTLRNLVGSSAGLFEIAYRHSVAIALDVRLLRSALFEHPLEPVNASNLEKVEKAVCPVSAFDLREKYQGPELGQKLSEAEKAWIASGFKATKETLLKTVLNS